VQIFSGFIVDDRLIIIKIFAQEHVYLNFCLENSWLQFDTRFDVEGFVTGFGNPTWAETHKPAAVTASAVKMLVEAGAKCIGKLHMDELAYRSISHQNLQRTTMPLISVIMEKKNSKPSFMIKICCFIHSEEILVEFFEVQY
jgi:hypothetical protein